MEAKFTKENTIKILESYYKEVEGSDAKIDITTSIGCQGLYEEMCANVHINLTNSINIGSEKIKSEREISNDEVSKVFSIVLGAEGYEVSNISYDAGITSGTYIWDQGSYAYFSGITVSMKRLEKQKIKGGI